MARDVLPEIWLIEDADECYEIETGKAVPVYKFVSKGWEPDESTVKAKDASGATLEQLVELCDRDAESINAHDYCGAHRLLGAVLFNRIGRKKATAIMRDIAERRGLHGMSGVCGTPAAFNALGVGNDWDGEYKAV